MDAGMKPTPCADKRSSSEEDPNITPDVASAMQSAEVARVFTLEPPPVEIVEALRTPQ
jgi:hypothetical protein